MFEGILIGTAILWALNALVVVPLASASVGRKLAAEGIDPDTLDSLPATQQDHWKNVFTGHYILWDVLVLGVAGVIMGLFGYYFIGISFEARGWPGMIAFIVASLLGVSMVRGGM